MKKPNVRVIPIEVEGAEKKPSSTRHRTLSGPAGIVKEQNDECFPQVNATSPLKHSVGDLSQPSMTKSSTLPRVHNIPIQVEGRNVKSPKNEKMVKSPKVNGCTVTKPKLKSPEKDHKKVESEAERQEKAVRNALKKIEDTLEELKSYEVGVDEFNGTMKDKQYRYLDEMLTRCMLKMDEIDTMGNENLRSARKNAVKKIQNCIDLLESKAKPADMKTEVPETLATSGENSEIAAENDIEMAEGQATEQSTNEISVKNEEFPEKIDIEVRCQNNIKEETDGNAVQKMEETMGETVKLEQSENVDICSEFQNETEPQKKDVEMTENQNVKLSECESKETSELVLTQEDVNQEVEERPNSSEVPEVEMTEIKSTVFQEVGSDVPEIEMTDNTKLESVGSNNSIAVKDVEIVSNNTSQEDIEMKDIQGTLDDIKKNVADDKSSISSQQEDTELATCQNTHCNNN